MQIKRILFIFLIAMGIFQAAQVLAVDPGTSSLSPYFAQHFFSSSRQLDAGFELGGKFRQFITQKWALEARFGYAFTQLNLSEKEQYPKAVTTLYLGGATLTRFAGTPVMFLGGLSFDSQSNMGFYTGVTVAFTGGQGWVTKVTPLVGSELVLALEFEPQLNIYELDQIVLTKRPVKTVQPEPVQEETEPVLPTETTVKTVIPVKEVTGKSSLPTPSITPIVAAAISTKNELPTKNDFECTLNAPSRFSLVTFEYKKWADITHHWAYPDAAKLTGMGILDSDSSLFNPKTPLTRYEALKALVQAQDYLNFLKEYALSFKIDLDAATPNYKVLATFTNPEDITQHVINIEATQNAHLSWKWIPPLKRSGVGIYSFKVNATHLPSQKTIEKEKRILVTATTKRFDWQNKNLSRALDQVWVKADRFTPASLEEKCSKREWLILLGRMIGTLNQTPVQTDLVAIELATTTLQLDPAVVSKMNTSPITKAEAAVWINRVLGIFEGKNK